MSVSSEGQGGSKDTLLWGLVFIILAAAVVGNYLLTDVVAAVRALGVVVVIAAAGAVALQTTKGKATHSDNPDCAGGDRRDGALAVHSGRCLGLVGQPDYRCVRKSHD